MYAHTKNYVASCLNCLQTRGHRNKQKAPIQKFDKTSYPLERIAADIVGPVTESTVGNKYILVISDYFTRWPEAYPLASTRTEDILWCLEHFISRHGVPKHIITDQGSNFVSRAAKRLYEKLGIHKHRTTAYHPQSDGLLERLNKTIVDSLRNLINTAREDWDRLLHLALMAHRTSVHASTKETPAYLLYGRDIKLPYHILSDSENPLYESVNDYTTDLQIRLKHSFEVVGKNLDKAQESRMDYQHKKAKLVPFQEGDQVYLFTPVLQGGLSKKLSTLNRGIYTITRNIGPVTFEITHNNNKSNVKVVHADRLTFIPTRRQVLLPSDKSNEISSTGNNKSQTYRQSHNYNLRPRN